MHRTPVLQKMLPCMKLIMTFNIKLVMPYGNTDLGQHWLTWWLVALWHEANTWSNVNLRSRYSRLGVISQDIPQPSTTKIDLKIMHLKFNWNFTGGIELILKDIDKKCTWNIAFLYLVVWNIYKISYAAFHGLVKSPHTNGCKTALGTGC